MSMCREIGLNRGDVSLRSNGSRAIEGNEQLNSMSLAGDVKNWLELSLIPVARTSAGWLPALSVSLAFDRGHWWRIFVTSHFVEVCSMENAERIQARVIPSIPSLIAWLSLCLLAAAAGHTLDQEWQPVWARMGAFGLVAAVGLGTLEKAREVVERAAHDRLMQARVEGGLARFNQHSAAIDSINEAMGRLTSYAQQQRRSKGVKAPAGKRPQSGQLLASFPLEITPVDDQCPAFDFESGLAIAGSVRQFTSRVVAFEHGVPIGTRMAMLNFKLDGREQLTFVVDIMWTEKAENGYASGGTVLAAGVPGQHDREVALAATGDI
jgi:hypothetical protein